MSFGREYLGRGWAFPFGFDGATGGVAMSEAEENIRQCISVILSTRPGERQMLPQFGCRIHELLFAPNTRATSALVAHHVEEALLNWEPRIEVTRVTAEPAANGAITVHVDYVIKATSQASTFSYALTNTR
jgi:uncharacterized protein